MTVGVWRVWECHCVLLVHGYVKVWMCVGVVGRCIRKQGAMWGVDLDGTWRLV